jgi:hypothetical protein
VNIASRRAVVLGGAPQLVQWGDWGWAATVRLAYIHPRTGALMTIDGEVLCWVWLLPTGRLWHPVWVG